MRYVTGCDSWHFLCEYEGYTDCEGEMTTGQTLLTLGAFMLLTTILLNFYGAMGESGTVINNGQDGILATTIATSYKEMARGLSFDQITDTSDIAIRNPLLLTPPSQLGPEIGEDSLALYNDFDDLNGLVQDKQVTGSTCVYRTSFSVVYVNPDNVDQVSTVQTFAKRLDMKTWRIYPPVTGDDEIDTIRTSMVLGYFHFN
jgi:hypothetical protein